MNNGIEEENNNYCCDPLDYSSDSEGEIINYLVEDARK